MALSWNEIKTRAIAFSMKFTDSSHATQTQKSPPRVG